MGTTPTIPEVFDLFEKAKSNRDRANVLKKHDSFALRSVIQGAFHPDLKLKLPPGNPPYTPDEAPLGHAPSSLGKECRKFSYFVDAGSLIPDASLRERLFIDILESVHAREAELILKMKNKDLQVKGLTYELASEVFPNINLPNNWKKKD